MLEAPEALASDSKILLLQRKHFSPNCPGYRADDPRHYSLPPLSSLVRAIKERGTRDEPGLKYCPKSQTDGSPWQQWPFEPIRQMGLDVWAVQRIGKRR